MSIYQDYGTLNSNVSSGASGFSLFGNLQGMFATLMIFFAIFSVLAVVVIIAQWKIFTKCGKPGWYAIVPIFNMWQFLEIVGFAGWWCLVPGANIIINLIAYYKIALKFGKSSGFAVCTVLFPMICLPIIAFSKDNNGGNNNFNNQNVQNYQYNYQNGQPYGQVYQPMEQQPMPNNVSTQYNYNPEPQIAVGNQINNQAPVQPAKVCPTCHNLNVPNSMFCEKCGTKL